MKNHSSNSGFHSIKSVHFKHTVPTKTRGDTHMIWYVEIRSLEFSLRHSLTSRFPCMLIINADYKFAHVMECKKLTVRAIMKGCYSLWPNKGTSIEEYILSFDHPIQLSVASNDRMIGKLMTVKNIPIRRSA